MPCVRRDLTPRDLVTPYGDIDLGQHWLMQWLVAWRHQAIAWTNADLHQTCSVAFIWEQFHSKCPWTLSVICVRRLYFLNHCHVSQGPVTWWRHQMETFSALLAICAGNSPVSGEFPHKGQWRGALIFSLICVWINGWVNNREAGDWRRYRAHYDVSVMIRYHCQLFSFVFERTHLPLSICLNLYKETSHI